VYSAPLAPLMGADLPAVLVEVGCFHPTATLDAQAIERQLTEYADAIAKAIETALPGLVP
jgi:N-acetylmuramoyl-L-alanine amidase